MTTSGTRIMPDVRKAYAEAMRVRVDALVTQGVRLQGNAFSPLLLVSGASAPESGNLLAEPVADALRKAFGALGYAPEEWCVLHTTDASGTSLAPDLLRLAVTTLDPATLVTVDEAGASDVREAFATELADCHEFEQAMLEPGYQVRVLGMRVMNLGDFGAALDDPSGRAKQLMWARLKMLPPLGEPY